MVKNVYNEEEKVTDEPIQAIKIALELPNVPSNSLRGTGKVWLLREFPARDMA